MLAMALCTSLVLSRAPVPHHTPTTLISRIPPIHMAATMTLTVTLVGCTNGVGVGLDPSNLVDMLREGSPAAASELQRGDKVLQWNGIAMVDPDSGQQRKLKDVVVPSDVHTLVVERAQSAAKSTAAPPQASKAAQTSEWKSTTDYKSHSWQATDSWTSDPKWG